MTWLWGSKYGLEDVAKLYYGLRRNIDQDFRFIVVTDRKPFMLHGVETTQIQDPELCKVKGCFARLRMFDPKWQGRLGIALDERIVGIDLDVVVVGKLDPIFNRGGSFRILGGANAANPCPFNGSLMMLRAGAHSEVWSDFSLEAAAKVPFYEFPDDQGWIWHKLPNAEVWKVGADSGVYAFQKPGWEGPGLNTNHIPDAARLVVFPGWRSPEQFKHLPWVRDNWRGQ